MPRMSADETDSDLCYQRHPWLENICFIAPGVLRHLGDWEGIARAHSLRLKSPVLGLAAGCGRLRVGVTKMRICHQISYQSRAS
jgi:hypothetical protein